MVYDIWQANGPVIMTFITATATSVIAYLLTRAKLKTETLRDIRMLDEDDRVNFRKELREEVTVLRKQATAMQEGLFRCEYDKIELAKRISQSEILIEKLRQHAVKKDGLDENSPLA